MAASDLVRPGLPPGQAPSHEALSLGDERGVPAMTILLRERDELTLAVRSRRSPRLGEEQEREQPRHLGLVREQGVEDAAEADCLHAQGAPDSSLPDVATWPSLKMR